MRPSDRDHASGQPLPPPTLDALRRRQLVPGLPNWVVALLGIPLTCFLATVVVVSTIWGTGDGGGYDPPPRMMSLTEAACQMLDDGDDPEFVYAVAKDLAADHPLTYGEDESIAARAAVDQAQAQGCG